MMDLGQGNPHTPVQPQPVKPSKHHRVVPVWRWVATGDLIKLAVPFAWDHTKRPAPDLKAARRRRNTIARASRKANR